MQKIGNKVSYIKKPLAKYSFVAAGLAAFACLFAVISVGLSYQAQGNAPLSAAAFGLCSMISSVSAVVYGVFSFFERDKNYLLAKISLAAAGLAVFFWVVVMVAAA